MKEVIVNKLGRRSCRVLIVARGSECKMTHSRGCWQETQSLTKGTSPQSYLGVLMLGLVAFPAVSDLREQGGSHIVFCDLVLEVTHCHFHRILFIRSMSLSPAHTEGKGN